MKSIYYSKNPFLTLLKEKFRIKPELHEWEHFETHIKVNFYGWRETK
jgi:hypothetical protein